MNKLFLTAVAGGMLAFSSCTQEDVTPVKPIGDRTISFRAGVASRVNPELDYTGNPSTFYVSAYANSHKADNGVKPDSLFWDEPFYLMGAGIYASTSNKKWPTREQADSVEFFAYAPSLKEIRDAALTQLDPTDVNNYDTQKENYLYGMQFFNLCQDGVSLDPLNMETTMFGGVQLYKGFKLGRFYVATDISKQVDFITAHIAAETPESEDEANLGVELKFKHQLSNIELRGFANNKDFNIEIAGVRIGRPYTGSAIFNFCDAEGNLSNKDGGQWGIAKDPQRLAVEYIYGNGDDIYRMGQFYNLNGIANNDHLDAGQAKSIMGKGGNAMVLPTKNGAWSGEGNPWIAPKYKGIKELKPWSADSEEGDMYFSILLRVTLRPTNKETSTAQIYPYGNNTTMNVVLFEKEKNSTKIVGRVASKDASIGRDNEIVEFGWAAVPVGVNWERGKKYIYTLDFSNGVGIQDPEDPKPGTPIIGGGIKFSVSVEDWTENPSNVDVPKEL